MKKLSDKTVELQESDREGSSWQTLIGNLKKQEGVTVVTRQADDGPFETKVKGKVNRVRVFATTDPEDAAIPPRQRRAQNAKVGAKVQEVGKALGLKMIERD